MMMTIVTRNLLVAILGVLGTVSVFAQEKPFTMPPLEVHTIESKFVDQTFEIHVQVPLSRTDGSERFPVMDMTDCYKGMQFGEITRLMQYGGDVPRFITVGIGYPLEHALGGMELRTRDLTPVRGWGEKFGEADSGYAVDEGEAALGRCR